MLFEHDELSFKDIVKKSNLCPATISYSLAKLSVTEIIEKNPDSRQSISITLKNKQRIKKLLDEMKN